MRFANPLFALLAFFIAALPLYSQRVNVDGYYINLKADTVFGKFIKYPEYSNSPSSVVFQPSASNQPVTLLPGQCMKFSVGHSETYISYQGKRLVNTTNYKDATGNNKDVYKEVAVFLRELFNNGHYQLYELKDNKRSNFYISADTIPLHELYYKEYTEEMLVIESHVFRDQLYILFRDVLEQNPAMKEEWGRLRYKDNSLVDFFELVTTGKANKVKEKYPVQFFAGAGISVNMFSVTGDNTGLNNPVGTYNTTVSPVLELGLKLFNQRNYGRLFFMARLDVYHYENSGMSTDYAGNINNNTFKAFVIAMPFSLGYKVINNKNVALALSAGVSGLYLDNNTLETVRVSGGPVREPDYTIKLTFNLFGEAELAVKKKISFCTGYYLPSSAGNYTIYSVLHSSVKFGLRYYIR